MKRDRFLKNSLILICSNLITSIFAFIFPIILSRELGAEGIGLYGLIMPIYDLFICLISGGMVAAISKIAAVYFSKDDFNNLNNSIDASLTFNSLFALLIVCTVFINAPYIGTKIVDDPRSIHALQAMCPAMFFIALSSILKGYFYGISQVKIPAIIDISEKFLRIVIIISIITIFSLKDVSSTVTAAYTTLTIGEFISFILLYIMYKTRRRKFRSSFSNPEDKLQLLFNILVLSFPLCLNGFLSTALGAVSTLITPRRLVASGIEYNLALAMIGKFDGMALNIIFFPITIINSISMVLIPDLSEKMSRKNYWSIEKRIHQIIKISLFLGICTMVICLSTGDYLGKLFYNRNDLGNYIKFASLAAPVTFVSFSTSGILNGIGKQNILLKNSLISAILEVILIYILAGISWINIYSTAISLIITSSTTLILNMKEIKKSSRSCCHIL
ncbi:stage V sporulation protein B [Clostridium ljungdahlii]|uniref:Multidrug-efflux transporter n=1 Tax=Clostridium ljungdahlii TaxID=1538 RepID=A0A162LDJ5_9CLOT|nr:stage V sporulation protein B [Clostridium ljungdahlii]OAA92106.1 Stage V sporulation protein B [Clostridium ljungdahlii]